MQEVKFICCGIEGLESIKGMWEQLNRHHMVLSTYFKQFYTFFTFDDRKKSLLAKSERAEFRLEIAQDANTGENIGYCISTVSENGIGEIESIFIRVEYRGKGIGDSLMSGAISWMNEKGAKKKAVAVGVGNEQAFSFYEKYGFYPRMTVLEQI